MEPLRQQQLERLPEDLVGRIPEDAHGTVVEERDAQVAADADDRVGGDRHGLPQDGVVDWLVHLERIPGGGRGFPDNCVGDHRER